MGRTKSCLDIFFLTIIMLVHSTIATDPKGFTLRMIHKDSEESPFYNPLDRLITPDERFQSLIDQSRARARYIASQINPDVYAVYAPVGFDNETYYYVASVGIGTFPNEPNRYMNYYLQIDSGSDLTWLECNGATESFNQQPDLYPWENSLSFIPALCENTSAECRECSEKGVCLYKEAYVGSHVTTGVYASEKFTFNSLTRRGHETFRLKMGCGFVQKNFTMGTRGRKNPIAGILGLGRGQRSFVTQLGKSGGKFSYCFDMTRNTYLSIGADATIEGQASSTEIKDFHESHYYLVLEDISVNGSRLIIPRNELEFNVTTEAGGCVIDSGAPFTIMYENIYDTVERSVKEYFRDAYHMHPAAFDIIRRHLCFYPIPEYRKPPITFHFQEGADFDVSESWFMYEGKLCLAIIRSDSNSPAVIFGAIQQTNKRILYDNVNMRLSFADEDCGTIPRRG